MSHFLTGPVQPDDDQPGGADQEGQSQPDRGPDDSRRHSGAGPQRQRRTQNTTVPSQADLLALLHRLAGLVLLGVVQPHRAQVVRSIFHDILQSQRQSSGAVGNAQIANDDLLAMVRANPAMVNLLTPFLTEEQVTLVMENMGGNPDGEI